MIKKPSDYGVAVCELRKVRPDTLEKPGYLDLINEHYSTRLGNTTIVTGYPTCGKSYFILNMQVALTCRYGWKHILFTPEMGGPEEIVMTLIEILIGVRGWTLTDRQIMDLMPFMDEHFRIIDPEVSLTMDGICKEVELLKGQYQTFSIDNLNDLSHTIPGTQDIYWEQQVVRFNMAAKRSGMHGFLSAHPAKPQPDDLLIPPAPDKIKGGSAFWSKGQTIISLMRQGEIVTVQFYKIKPRIIGKTGKVEIYVNLDRNTYYQHSGNVKKYMFDQPDKNPEQISAF